MKVFCKYCVKTKSGILSKTFKTVKLTILLCKLFVRISEFTVAIYRYFLNDPFTLSLKKSITLYVDIVLICIDLHIVWMVRRQRCTISTRTRIVTKTPTLLTDTRRWALLSSKVREQDHNLRYTYCQTEMPKKTM